jgi:LacI family transcriptional regulator
MAAAKKKVPSAVLALAGRSESAAVDPADIALVSRSVVKASISGTKPVSVREVARRAKVSPATVSLVINDNPRISASTQKRVRKIMDQLGYRPNRLAQNLGRRRTQTLAVMVPSLSHAFADRYFGEIISGVWDQAVKRDYKVMLEQATPEFIAERRHVQLVETRFVDGVLCLGNSDRHLFLNDFAAGRYPMIAVNCYFPQWDVDYVVCDYRHGTEQAMNYLLQLGHRRIGMVSGSKWVRTARDVVEVYQQKLSGTGVTPVDSWREDGLFTEAGGSEAARRLLKNHPELTAILAGNDKMAIGVIHFLNESGRKAPADVSVVGFDDMQDAAFANPALTSVHLPLYECGVLACDSLIDRIGGTAEPVRTVLETHLKVRNSSGIARE